MSERQIDHQNLVIILSAYFRMNSHLHFIAFAK